MKTFEGEKGNGMSEREARKFLAQSRSTLMLGTTDADGSPMIHPVWYYFDDAKTRIYFYTEPALKKAANIKRRSQVYFDVDSDRWPYKGVKGKGRARKIASKAKALALASEILARYVRKGNPMIKAVLAKVGTGGYVIFEITPAYFTSWDYGKLVSQAQASGLKDAIIS
jgi:nitroimidazol reductase NimA-like FMN-containing flavoprotein (pyridoxamine 5'-phosphate oxidase superfamily)